MKIIIKIISVLLILSPWYAWSQEPPPRPLISSSHENEKSDQTQNHSDYQEDTTEQRPLITKTSSPNSTEKTDCKKNERLDKPPNEWWMVGATLWMAFVTTLLAFFTAYLWDATRKLSRSAEETAKRQLRAFIFGKGFNHGPNIWDGKIKEYVFSVTWENVGLTPGVDVCNWIQIKTIKGTERQDVVFSKSAERHPAVMGPRATSQSGFITIPMEKMMQKWQGETKIFLWSRVEYKDIFDSEVVHFHEQCASVELLHDPSEIPPEGHPAYINFVIYGDQNSTG